MNVKLSNICRILLVITLSASINVEIWNLHVTAYDDIQKAVSENFDGTSRVEQGYRNMQSNISNCRFCYAYDYDGDGKQEAFALSGVWEEGPVNGTMWFIDSSGNYSVVKEGINYEAEYFTPELVYAGNQIFLIQDQRSENGRYVSLMFGCRNGQSYFPSVSEQVMEFHDEIGHHYGWDIASDSGREYFFDETTGEFSLNKEIEVVLNGRKISFDQPPVIKDGRTLVPLRAIFEAMGATVEWNQAIQTITSSKGTISISLSIGCNVLYKNNASIYLDVPAQIINDRTLVPARAVAEAFGADVSWDGDSQVIYINY